MRRSDRKAIRRAKDRLFWTLSRSWLLPETSVRRWLLEREALQ